MTRSLFIIAIACGFCSGAAWAQKAAPLLPGGNSKDPVAISAAKLDYFDKDQKLVYSGGVVAKQGTSTLKASVLVIFLDTASNAKPAGAAPTQAGPAPAGNSVRRMEAEGPVTLVSNDQVGTGDRGVYDKPANNVTLIGHVTLTQGTNITKGDTLTYNLTTAQAVVTGNVRSLFTPAGGDKKPKPGKKH